MSPLDEATDVLDKECVQALRSLRARGHSSEYCRSWLIRVACHAARLQWAWQIYELAARIGGWSECPVCGRWENVCLADPSGCVSEAA